MKKRILAVMLAAVAALSVMGCSVNKTVTKTETYTDANGNTVTSTQVLDSNGNVKGGTAEIEMANPWVDSDQAGVKEATGFDMVPPAGSANIAYSYMPSTGMAQMNFVMDNAMWVYRMQPTEMLIDISGMYYEWDYTGECLVAGMEAVEYSYASGDSIDNMSYVRVINWYDAANKVTHSLSVLGTDLNGMDLAVYAEQM